MGAPGGRVRPVRLLIVEADRRSFDELREAMIQDGHECEVALDLETARAILQERRMDIAVLNLQLAEQEEEELLAELKDMDPSMRVVLYNGTAEERRRRRLRRRGVDSYITTASDLTAVIRSIRRVIREKL